MLSQCAVGLPMFLVWVVGAALIGARMKSNRTAAGLAIGGIVVAILDMLLGIGSSAATPAMLSQGYDIPSMTMFFSIFAVCRAIVSAISWGLVLAALIMALGKPEPREGIPPRD